MAKELGEAKLGLSRAGLALACKLVSQLATVNGDLAIAEERLDEHEAEKEAIRQDAMISRYKAMGWEWCGSSHRESREYAGSFEEGKTVRRDGAGC